MWNVAPLAPACGSNIIHEYRIRVQSYLTSVRTIQETNHRETYPAPRRFPIKGYEALDNHNLHLAFFLPVLLKIGLNELDEVSKLFPNLLRHGETASRSISWKATCAGPAMPAAGARRHPIGPNMRRAAPRFTRRNGAKR